jgi:AcrR family transcriptional regulator
MARKSAANENTREQVLRVTEQLLYDRGFMGTSMAVIADQIGVRQAALYYHFPKGKEELCLEVAFRALERDGQGFFQATQNHRTARAKLKAIASWVLNKPVRTDRIITDMARFVGHEYQQSMGEMFMVKLFAPVLTILDHGVANQEFKPHDTTATAWLFLSMLNGFEQTNPMVASYGLAHLFVDTLVDGIHV